MTKNINIGAGRFRKDGWINIDHASAHYHKNVIDIDCDFLDFNGFAVDGVDNAYCSHVVEHLPDNAVASIFCETHRVLKKGGFCRITCPDAGSAITALRLGAEDFFSIYRDSPNFNSRESMKKYGLITPLGKSSIYQRFMWFLCPRKCVCCDINSAKFEDEVIKHILAKNSDEDALDIFTDNTDFFGRENFPWMHINWFTHDKLIRMLRACGFSNVYRSGYGMSFSPEMRDTEYFDNSLPEISLYVEAVK